MSQSPAWWERDGLTLRQQEVTVSGIGLRELYQAEETPSYLYDTARVHANVRRLQGALAKTAHPFRLYYAMKSNRYGPLLQAMHPTGLHGLDVCSIREIEHALACGFLPAQLTFTAHGVARREWVAILEHPEIWVNADSLADLEKIGQICPGRTIGVRLNPRVGLGYRENPRLQYAEKGSLTKFGLVAEELPEAFRLAETYNLKICGLHVHSGCGYLNPQLSAFAQILQGLAKLLQAYPQFEIVNLGGGLGIPLCAEDEALDLSRWAQLIRDTLSAYTGEIWVEPGDYLVKDAGFLVVEVTQVLRRGDQRLVTVNAGFNIHPEPVFYDLPLHVEPVLPRTGEREPTILAGNLNEVQDLWFESIPLPPLQEGDHLVFFNAGGYGAAMHSDHCLRGVFTEKLINS